MSKTDPSRKALLAAAAMTPGMKAATDERRVAALAKLEKNDRLDKRRLEWIVAEWALLKDLAPQAVGWRPKGVDERRR